MPAVRLVGSVGSVLAAGAGCGIVLALPSMMLVALGGSGVGCAPFTAWPDFGVRLGVLRPRSRSRRLAILISLFATGGSAATHFPRAEVCRSLALRRTYPQAWPRVAHRPWPGVIRHRVRLRGGRV